MLSEADLVAFALTLRLALVSTAVLLVLGTPLAWWLARTHSRGRFVVDALVSLPLVLPPTVLGFYLLIALGPRGPFSDILQAFDLETLAFSFTGLVIGSVIYSLPFVVQPLAQAFAAIGQRPLEVAATLGAGPMDRFRSIVLPLARPGFLTATALGFAHTLGEFGVVLMIGGSIPGETRVLSIAIYEQVEAGNYANAHVMAMGLLLVAVILLVSVYAFNRRVRVIPA